MYFSVLYCTDIGPRGKSSLTAQALYKKTIDAVILSSGSNNYEIRCKGQLDVSIGVIHPSYLPGPQYGCPSGWQRHALGSRVPSAA